MMIPLFPMTNERIPIPLPEEAKLTRYYSIDKFVSLVTSSQLVLTQLKVMTDEYEAKTNQAAIKSRANRIDNEAAKALSMLGMSVDRQNAYKWLRHCTYVSCWYASESESTSMWMQYAGNLGCAVITTVDALHKAFIGGTPDHHCGLVKYIEWEKQEVLYENNRPLAPAFFKRSEFSSEREWRFAHVPQRTLECAPQFPDFFRLAPNADEALVAMPRTCVFDLELNTAIAEVRVANTSPPWWPDTIEKLCKKCGLNIPITRSSCEFEADAPR